MVLTKTKTETKNIVLLALVSTTFILSIVSYAIPQQAFGQGLFQTEQEQQSESDPNNQSSPLTTATTTADDEEAEEDNQKIILGSITIPINSNTTLSLEMPDSKLTVEPNE
jgi:hypothetical protein